jgi:hypothetical protein
VPIRVLLVAAVLVVVVWGLRRLFGGYEPRPRARHLSAREWALIEAVCDAMFPPGGAIPPSGREAGVPDYVDGYVAAVPPLTGRLMRMLFLLVEQATLIFPAPGSGGRRRFSDLTVEQRVASLESWRTSGFFPRRLVFTSLRAILCMGYLADPAVLRALRLAPWDITPPVAEADLLYPPVGQPRSAIRHTETTPPSDGTPLEIGGPIHPDYRGSAP